MQWTNRRSRKGQPMKNVKRMLLKFNACPNDRRGCSYNGERTIDKYIDRMDAEVISKSVTRWPGYGRIQVVIDVRLPQRLSRSIFHLINSFAHVGVYGVKLKPV